MTRKVIGTFEKRDLVWNVNIADMGPCRFDSRTRPHMWLDFLGSRVRCERFSPCIPVFSPINKTSVRLIVLEKKTYVGNSKSGVVLLTCPEKINQEEEAKNKT